MRLRHSLWALALAMALAAPALHAQVTAEEPAARALGGTLKRIKESGVVRIGYRENIVPFSSASAGGKPQGYSIDLCLALVEDLAATVGARELRVEYRRVTPTSRLEDVASGRVDLECGSTTITAERAQRVAFSPVIFVAGTRLMVKRGRAIHSMRDLAGKTVAGVSGTTNARALVTLAAGRVRDLRITTADTYEQALAYLDTDAVDALAADDILIAGFIAGRNLQGSYIMVGEPLTHEPYGIAFARDDPALAQAVKDGFVRLATTKELRQAYNKWFLRPLPSGQRLGLPMSSSLERAFQVLGLPPE